jgi:hypothetical protein
LVNKQRNGSSRIVRKAAGGVTAAQQLKGAITMTLDQLNKMLKEYRSKYLETLHGFETYIKDDERSRLNDHYGKKIKEVEMMIRNQFQNIN